MFCEQCEQTASGQGCHQFGACGKSPQVNLSEQYNLQPITTTDADLATCPN